MKKSQTGAVIVEFALVSVLFLTVLLGIMDFGRILFLWNSTAEATRLGARKSVVCAQGAARVLADMQKIVPITSANLQIDWYADDGTGKISISTACDSTNCVGVAVRITGLKIAPVSPISWIGFKDLTVPGFSTYLPREVMGQDPDSATVCS